MRGMTITVLVLGSMAFGGCTTGIQLTDEGREVQQVEYAEMKPGCRLVGDVAIGIPPDAAHAPTKDDLIALMRNKAGREGGDTVVVDWAEERDAHSEEAVHWVGRGRAYNCPEDESGGSTPIEEDTGLEEEAGEDGSGESEGSEESPGGVSDDELLG